MKDSEILTNLGIDPARLDELPDLLPEESQEQLRKAVALVLAGFIHDGWRCIVIGVNDDLGMLALAGSTGVNDMEAAEIVDHAKSAILAAATADAPDRKEWS